MSGHIRSAGAQGSEVFVQAQSAESSYAPPLIGFSGAESPPLPESQLGPVDALINTLSSAVLRGAAPGSTPVTLVAGAGSIVWPPDEADNNTASGRRLGSAEVQSTPSQSVLCSPAYSMTAARFAAPPGGGSGASSSLAAPLPPCGYPLDGTSLRTTAPPPSIVFPSKMWASVSAAAATSGRSSGFGVPTLDVIIVQWGASPVPGAAGWNGASLLGPGVNVTALNAVPSNAASFNSSSGRALSHAVNLRGSLDSENRIAGAALRRMSEATAPQPCSGSLAAAIHAGQLLPKLTPALSSHTIDTKVSSMKIAGANGTLITTWPTEMDSEVLLFLPFTAATELQNASSSNTAPLSGLPALKVSDWRDADATSITLAMVHAIVIVHVLAWLNINVCAG